MPNDGGQPYAAPQQPYTAQGQPQYAPPAGQAYYQAYDQLPSLQSNGTMALVLSLISFLGLGPFTSIPGWVIGHSTLKKARAAGIPDDQVKSAYWGKIIGMISTILFIISIVALIAFFVVIVSVAANDPALLNELEKL